ncbi:hypothetical protein [Sulfurimonas sp.]
MIKNIECSFVDYKVGSYESDLGSSVVEVSGEINLVDKNENIIYFTLEYRKTEEDCFLVEDIDLIDMEEFDNISSREFLDIMYDFLPIEDIERDISKAWDEKNSEDRDYIDNLKRYDPNEYICVMRNDFGGFLYE